MLVVTPKKNEKAKAIFTDCFPLKSNSFTKLVATLAREQSHLKTRVCHNEIQKIASRYFSTDRAMYPPVYCISVLVYNIKRETKSLKNIESNRRDWRESMAGTTHPKIAET